MTDIQQPTLPRPRTPGPEMAALDRFYTDVTWTGTIEPNGMGPGSPAMTARGRGVQGLPRGEQVATGRVVPDAARSGRTGHRWLSACTFLVSSPIGHDLRTGRLRRRGGR